MSANSTAISTSAPPAGSESQHRVQRLGFLRDGLKPATRSTRPPMPPNGLLQSLHRGAEGRYRKTRRARTSDPCPSLSTWSQSPDALGLSAGIVRVLTFRPG